MRVPVGCSDGLRIAPSLGVTLPEVYLPLVFTRILDLQYEKSVNVIDSIAHDRANFVVRYARVFGVSETSRAWTPGMDVFNRRVSTTLRHSHMEISEYRRLSFLVC